MAAMILLINFPDWTLLAAELLLEFLRGISIILVASALFVFAGVVILGVATGISFLIGTAWDWLISSFSTNRE
jgi:hypothetical protein